MSNPDLSSFIELGNRTVRDEPASPRTAPRLPRPVAPSAPIAKTNGHSTLSVADVYLTPAPKPVVEAVENEQIAEANGAGQWNTTFPPAPTPKPRRRVMGVEMPTLGMIEPLMADDDVHDILINGTQPIYVDVAGQIIDTGMRFATHDEVWKLAEAIMESTGQRLNPERPLIDTRLPDGSRVNIVAPPMAVDGVTISIRKFPSIHITLETMVENKQMSAEMADFLSRVVAARVNLIIAGGTSSGKTTLMNALSGAISAKERIVTVEDAAELRLQQPHVVRLEAKIAAENPDNSVTIRDLVKNALRMRPDRIIVGESRGPEAFDVIQAMNTGHEGSMTTLHANSPRDALSKLETMVSMAIPQFPVRIVRQQIAATVNLIVQMGRSKEGLRRITHVSELSGMEGDNFIMQDIITFTEAGGYRWSGAAARHPHVSDAARQSGMLKGMR